MLPNWIIAGAPKAGTSALFRWLTDHPEVSGPVDKETFFFVDRDSHMFKEDRNFAIGGLAGYERLFASCEPGAKVILEATPSYIYSATALAELPNLPTEPRFIFLLREPVGQLRSLYRYFQQNWNWIPRGMSFRAFLEAAERGTNEFKGNELAINAIKNAWYPEHLQRWRDAVGEDRMLILLFEDLVGESSRTLRKVAEALGIQPDFYESYDFPAENSTYVARSGALQELNIRLREYLPKGRLYSAARTAYRALNTRAPSSDERDLHFERELRNRFAPLIAQLERDYGLDLAKWKGAGDRGKPALTLVMDDEVPGAPQSTTPGRPLEWSQQR